MVNQVLLVLQMQVKTRLRREFGSAPPAGGRLSAGRGCCNDTGPRRSGRVHFSCPHPGGEESAWLLPCCAILR